ncbi:MAG: hypothetical protein ABIH46_08660 [Chloroflexota bacterium]
MREIEMMDPTGVPRIPLVPLAPRIVSLDGKTLGLLSNGKPNAMPLLESLAKLLSRRYKIEGVVKLNRGDDVHHYYRRSMGKADEDLVKFVDKSDVVLSGIGD